MEIFLNNFHNHTTNEINNLNSKRNFNQLKECFDEDYQKIIDNISNDIQFKQFKSNLLSKIKENENIKDDMIIEQKEPNENKNLKRKLEKKNEKKKIRLFNSNNKILENSNNKILENSNDLKIDKNETNAIEFIDNIIAKINNK